MNKSILIFQFLSFYRDLGLEKGLEVAQKRFATSEGDGKYVFSIQMRQFICNKFPRMYEPFFANTIFYMFELLTKSYYHKRMGCMGGLDYLF